jgi:hypothetical protein
MKTAYPPSISPNLRVPLSYDYLWKGLFVDLMLSMASASIWLRMTDAELGVHLTRLHDWVVSDENGDRYAIEWLCLQGRPPTAGAIRAALKAAVPLPTSYWVALARPPAQDEEPFDPITAALDELIDADERW